MPEYSEGDVKLVMEKTEQTLRILTSCWDERIQTLLNYFNQKHSFWNLLKRKSPEVQTTLRQIILSLKATNERETKVLQILLKAIPTAKDVAQKTIDRANKSEDNQLTDQVKADIVMVLVLIEKYERYIAVHQDILNHEKAIIAGDESQVSSYLKKIDAFLAELQNLHDDRSLRQRLQQYSRVLEAIQKKRNVNSPGAYIEPSVYSAIFRVIGGNLTSTAMLGKNPFDNPYFWQLTGMTTLVIIVFNFTDYYYQWITRGTARFVKLRKSIGKEKINS